MNKILCHFAFCLIVFLFVFISSCSIQQKTLQNENKLNNQNYILNNSMYVLIADTSENEWISDDVVRFWTPDSSALFQSENILYKAVKQQASKYWTLLDTNSLDQYYRQYVFYIDSQSDSLIYINAFCEIPEMHILKDSVWIQKAFDWQNDILGVDDGGDCYWSIRINISKMTYQLSVN